MKPAESKPLPSLVFIPLLLLVFIRPFLSDIAYPAIEIYYENFLIALAIITILINKKSFSKNPYSVPILLILSAYLTSSMQSINFQNSIRETIKFISYICIFFIVSRTNDIQKRTILKTIVFCASIIGAYSIYQYLWGYQHTLEYLKKINSDFLSRISPYYGTDILISKRAIGTFPSPNILASYLAMVFFLSLSLTRNSTWHKGWCVAPLLTAAALVVTKSLGAWLIFTMAIIISLSIFYKSSKRQKLISTVILLLVIVSLGFVLSSRWNCRLLNLDDYQNPLTQRLNYWRTAIAVIEEHLILGVGPGNFKEVFLNYKAGSETSTVYAHNILLHMWAETGILGVVGIIYLVTSFFKKSKDKPESLYILLSGLVFILHNLIDNTYFIPQAGLFWWILLGLGSVYPDRKSR